ncbi:MAG TPA: aspartate kinase [Clostridia bacterium]|nr:aspartate kinase [Clostridia bacterium]
MGIVVQKYGGTSVGSTEKIKNVARRVVRYKEQGNQVVTVVSAVGHTTDQLVQMAREITDDPPKREMDMLLSTGEQISISLLAMAIKATGHDVISLTGAQAGIVTNNVHTKAKIMEVSSDRLKKELDAGKIVIVAGFQGVTIDNEITTLGRGGSDTTAVAVAAALRADVCEIYTDVDGVYTTDPRMVPEARKLSQITYDEMLELASLGAGVLQPRAVEFGKIHDVVIHVRSSLNDNEGTIVKGVNDMDHGSQLEQDIVVTGVAYDLNTARIGLFNVPDKPGVAFKVFSALAERNINVDMIIQGTMRNGSNDISFTVAKDDVKAALEVIEVVGKELNIERAACDQNVSKVSIVGAGMITNPGVAAMMFEALAEENINIHMISTSEIKVSCIIDKEDTEKAVKAVHKKFNLEEG